MADLAAQAAPPPQVSSNVQTNLNGQTNINMPKKPSFFSSNTFLITVVVLIIVFIVGVYFFYRGDISKQNLLTQSNNPDLSLSDDEEKEIFNLLTINPKNPAIKSAGFVYVLKTSITDLKSEEVQGKKLLKINTAFKGSRIPSQFYLDSATKYRINDAGKVRQASQSALQKGQNIEIEVRKGLKVDYFQVLSVEILLNQKTNQATSSASGN